MKKSEEHWITRVFITSKLGRFFLKVFLTVFFLVILWVLSLVLVDKVVLNFYVKSKKLVEVPYVSGMTLNESIASLKGKNLKWKVIGKGKYVARTEPPGGILVKEGRIITLYLSDTPR